VDFRDNMLLLTWVMRRTYEGNPGEDALLPENGNTALVWELAWPVQQESHVNCFCLKYSLVACTLCNSNDSSKYTYSGIDIYTQYLWRIGSRSPEYTKIHGCPNPLFKNGVIFAYNLSTSSCILNHFYTSYNT
jgi:hypothetical protein